MRTPRLLVALVAASLITVWSAPAAADVVTYRPPVLAPVSDPYRAPADPYGPGNRGIEYATGRSTPVRAVADGVVTFAGEVAGVAWITVAHADGLRSTLGPMEMVHVSVGQRVRQGEIVGTTAGRLLFTLRRGDEYLDPAPYLVEGPPRVRLVTDPAGRPAPRAAGSSRARAWW